MKPFQFILASLAGLTLLTHHAYGDSKYTQGNYAVDPMHSKIGFEVPHLVISSVEGKFTKFDGTIQMNEKFEKSSVKVNAEINSVDTGVSKRDEHLKSPDFFDAKKFAQMKFESTEIVGKPEKFSLIGNLTIKGVTRKVTFETKYLGTVTDGYGNQKAAFVAKAEINRKDFGLTWNNMVEAGPVVGDTVTLDLKIQAALEKKK